MEAIMRAKLWAENPCFDADTQQASAACMADENALLSAFGTELRFGTGGLRGVLGVGTARLNRYTVARATLGLARSLKRRGATRGVAVAYDSRHGSEEFAAVTAGVLASQGICAHVFAQLAPTPMLSFAVRSLALDAGVMITASHNPAEYNGYKVYGADGCQITDKDAADITECIRSVSYTDPVILSQSEARTAELWLDVPDTLRRSFAQACLFCRADPSVSTGIHVVYTPLYGTGLMPVREVLKCMQGVRVTEVAEQCEPNGDFPTCPKPNPEVAQALDLGIALSREVDADLLLATDPDCDRVGIAVPDANGEYVQLSGNELGLLLLEHVLSARSANGLLPKQAVVAKSIVSSDLAFPIAQAYGVQVCEVLTGFKYIGELIGRLEAEGRENDFVFGFEESCGYLAGTHVRDKDGVMASMLVCEMAQALKSRGLSVWEALQRLYARYGFLSGRSFSFAIAGALPMQEMERIMQNLRSQPLQTLAQLPVSSVRDYLAGVDDLPRSNVLVYEAGDCKVIIRPSGTEPKVKVYLFARSASRSMCEALLDALETELRALIH